MSRYRGPRVKIVRRLGKLRGLTTKVPKPKPNTRLTKKRKVSQYRLRLEEKQKLRYYYGLTERQLLQYVCIARKAKRSTGQALLQLIETRLDNIVFRLNMAPTIPAARQYVNHGHIAVNQRTIDIPSYRCNPQDVVTVRDRSRSHALIARTLSDSYQNAPRSQSTLSSSKRSALMNQRLNQEPIDLKLNQLLVVEYYSRQA